MLRAQIQYVEFPAKDIKSTKQFFTTTFGWEFVDYGAEYTAFKKSTTGLDGGIYHSELSSKSTTNGSALVVLYTENLEQSLQEVSTNGGMITTDIFSFPGGRRFHFTEPSGNELAVWSDK